MINPMTPALHKTAHNRAKTVREGVFAQLDGGDLSRCTIRDEPPCVFLSLNFKLQTNNFNKPAHKGKHRKKNKNGKEKTDWESRHLGGGDLCNCGVVAVVC